jgi:hypothetical protein
MEEIENFISFINKQLQHANENDCDGSKVYTK